MMKRQINFSVLVIACTLLVAGCDSSPSGIGQTGPTQVAPTVVAAATTISSNSSH